MYKIFSFLLLLLPVGCLAQLTISGKVLNQTGTKPIDTFTSSGPLKSKLLVLKTKSDSINRNRSPEKLYLQFDKPYYSTGDTIWFKAYLLNSYLKSADLSQVINIDIANDSNKVIRQYRLPVKNGITWGDISLDEKEFTTGTYTLRAYTNWMRNFGEDYFFYKSFYVTSANENNWLVNRQVNETTENGLKKADVKLQFTDMDKKPYQVKDLSLQVMNGNRHLYQQKFQTDLSGSVAVNFNLPQKPSSLAIVAESEKKEKRAVIPVIINRPENTDVQFLPEGSSLVAGLPARIGFKATGEDGKGVNISGIIIDKQNNKIAEFASQHNGMGSFGLAVKDGETYSAKINLPGGLVKDYPLPPVKSSGMVLHVKNPIESDSLEVSVAATNDLAQTGSDYYLIGKARGIVCYAAVFSLKDGNALRKKISKGLFPSGIIHFTVMTTKYQPLNERLVFIDQRDNLNIKITADKPFYDKRDSVALKLTVTDKEGNPVQGDFSMAVTDDAQVKTDTLNSENMITRLLVTSDLKGYVEEPGYYLSSKTNEAWWALDNLLLTQGWVGYNWPQVLNPPAIAYQPETDFMVKGRVSNVFNKSVKGTDILLFSKSPAILMDTVTDQNGKFVFNRFPKVDTPLFVLKAVNKNGKSFNVGINIDDAEPPAFTKPFKPSISPWYVNSNDTLLNNTKNNALAKQQKDFPTGGQILKEVKINAKKFVKGSQNLNGPGNSDLVMDEKDMEKAGKKTWLDLMYENIPGFKESAIYISTHTDVFVGNLPVDVITHVYKHWYFIHDKSVNLVIDGILLSELYSPLDFITFKNYLESHNAEDIKGIEVNSSNTYAINYARRFGFALSGSPYGVSSDTLAFVEITTRSGHGPVIDNTPGMYLYKPLPISWPKQFYKPKYTIKDIDKHLPDLRSTIDWEPNITTDANGEAIVTFYTADKPSTYTIIMEGSDMTGGLGYKSGKISVTQPKEKTK
jgi:hypothetical protein